LQDFNEADRYLVDTDSLYQNLKEIKEIENWSLSADDLTPTQQDYVEFHAPNGKLFTMNSAKAICFTKNRLTRD
jgi:hypothetical protein